MVVVKYHNQKQFMVEEFVLAYSSREVRIHYEGEVLQQEVGHGSRKKKRRAHMLNQNRKQNDILSLGRPCHLTLPK